jgi:hypothetical protein
VKKPKAKKRGHAGLQHQCSKPVKRVVGRPFQPGQSGNPSGRRKGSVSPTAALRRALSRSDADAIARRFIRLAKAGDAAAAKLIFDRIDHPLSGPMAIALAQANAASEVMPQEGNVQVIITDNGRDPCKKMTDEELLKITGGKPFDHAGFVQCARELYGIPATTTTAPPTPPPTGEGSEAESEDSDEGEPLSSIVQSGAEFLQES